MTTLAPRPAVQVPFICPACAGENAANLIALSRAGGIRCVACQRWLRSVDVAKAIHAPRRARSAEAPQKIPVSRVPDVPSRRAFMPRRF
ncbi:MAG TPA: hypothetical protein VM889_07845 [Candidatus Thermoplasmatota archaeon]|nr:hypothetical protein [Candidatus Thermoplasmatota archaeon]